MLSLLIAMEERRQWIQMANILIQARQQGSDQILLLERVDAI